MLRITSKTDMKGYTEYEEDILFDEDDPDFNLDRVPSMPLIFRDKKRPVFGDTLFSLTTPQVTANMSLVSVHPAELHSSHGSLTTLSHSLDDITGRCSPQVHSEHAMTIEELRLQMSSCFSCGVSWAEAHVSLDCTECGGYALERPCPSCEGTCGALWKRDLTMSHACGKARWQGQCNHSCQLPSDGTTNTLAQDLCNKFEKMSANS